MSERIFMGQNQLLFNAQGANGVSEVYNCGNATNIIVAVTAPLNSAFTLNFQGSIGKSVTDPSAPDFSSAQAVANMWDYVAAYDTQDPTSIITGDTGVAITAAAVASNTRMYIVNVSFLRYFSLQVSGWSAGSVSAVVVGSAI